MSTPIAIVGLACLYPDAHNVRELWENILAQRRSFRRIPDERLRADDYLDEDPRAPDRTYVAQAAVIEGYDFDRNRFRIVGSTFRSADLVHWVALDVASQALEDAGFPDGSGLNRETTGVILGNTLTGEFSRSAVLRLRWPYVRRVLDKALADRDWNRSDRADFLAGLEEKYKAPFPEVGEESLAGGLSNTIAGRICNYYNLKGGAYTVDGACASSLVAVANACCSLAEGDLDFALAGGVDLSLDPFEIVGFAKTGALAPDLMRVYDTQSAGFWPGEGCGFAVLMRYDDAMDRKRPVYAKIHGWGISSDGAGGITRPEIDGQMHALHRAYRRAGYTIGTVGYFEGHGTGTAVGDKIEIEAIARALRESGTDNPAAVIGSVKANIGHTKAAAGIAGLLKATMAVHSGILPATTGCDSPANGLTEPSAVLRTLRKSEPWSENKPRRAGISAMGFGGINVHITIEEPAVAERKTVPFAVPVQTSNQDSELFLFSNQNTEGLLNDILRVENYAAKLSFCELTDLSAQLARNCSTGNVRAAVIASTPSNLADRLARLKGYARTGKPVAEHNLFLARVKDKPRLALLFPGQGTALNLDGGCYANRFASIADLYKTARLLWPSSSLVPGTEVAQRAIAVGSIAALKALTFLGLDCDLAIGHSLGELTALHWAGAFSEEALLRLATVRGEAMAKLSGPEGSMCAVAASATEVKALIGDSRLWMAGLNSPTQTVVSGDANSIRSFVHRAKAQGYQASILPVSAAFHTPFVADAREPLLKQMMRETFAPLNKSVISTVTGSLLNPDTDLREILCRQITSPVRFLDAIHEAGEVDLFIEAGPGQVLSGIVNGLGRAPAIALDAGGPSLTGLLRAAGAAFVAGVNFHPAALFEDRLTRPFKLDWKPRFFINPCELAPVIRERTGEDCGKTRETASLLNGTRQEIREPDTKESSCPLEIVRELVARRVELPLDRVKASDRLLSDLHLNSISVGQVVAEAVKMLHLPPLADVTGFANQSIEQVALALENLMKAGPVNDRPAVPAGVDSWVRPFKIMWSPHSNSLVRSTSISRAPDKMPKAKPQCQWRLFMNSDDPRTGVLESCIGRLEGKGVLVYMTEAEESACMRLLLDSTRTLLNDPSCDRFLLIQNHRTAAGFARTLFLENPGLKVSAITLEAFDERAAEWIQREALAMDGYTEAKYNEHGERFEPRLVALSYPEQSNGSFPINEMDVILVTGGGKGIGFECGFALAKESGAPLILFGRSEPSRDNELYNNLQRLSTAGIRFSYCSVDITDIATLKAAIRDAESRFGEITVFLHAAGNNAPCLIDTLNFDAFKTAVDPKVLGARNILSCLTAGHLRLFLTFGSIISRTGLKGEAHYAVANEWLSTLTEAFQKDHPECRCHALEWSVWSQIGMGHRLGRIETLMRQGITPISPETGVKLLKQLLTAPPPVVSVVITGRFGDPPTLKLDKPELPFRRFLEKTRAFYPGIELVADSVISADSDPYVRDHNYHGEYLFPAVLGLEAMANAAMALTRSDRPPAFEDVKFTRPIVIPARGETTIRTAALMLESNKIKITLRSEQTGFQTNHFSAVCRFASGAGLITSGSNFKTEATFSEAGITLDITGEIYEKLLFHTGRFRRIKEYRLLRGRECVAQLMPDAETEWFGRYLPQDRVLGDPGVRDAAIHAIQACIPHARLLPVGAERIVIGKIPCLEERLRSERTRPLLLIHARERRRQGNTFYFDLELISENREILESWENLQLRKIEDIPRQIPWPVALLSPYVERRVEELIPGVRLNIVVCHTGGRNSVSSSVEALQVLGISASALSYRADGKPEAADGQKISLAHAGGMTLALSGTTDAGCDMEAFAARTADEWESLLGLDRFNLTSQTGRELSEDLDSVATRIWAASEALKKAGAALGAPLSFAEAGVDGWATFTSGAFRIATCVANIEKSAEPYAIAVAALLDHSA